MNKAYLEVHEVQKLEEAAAYLRDRLLIRLLFHLGCRISEALAVEVKDIDFDAGTVTIQHLKSRVKLACPECGARLARMHKYCPACGATVKETVAEELAHRRIRTLPLDEDTLKMMGDYVRRGGPVRRGTKMLLFGLTRHRGWQIVREAAERAGLPKLVNPETGRVHNVSPHKLRDSFAVNAMKIDNSGDGMRLLQEHLGHASFNTTAKYRKVAGEELKTWYKKLWEKR
jgi:integrase/recombinase XerD